jgi:hypothetical protein
MQDPLKTFFLSVAIHFTLDDVVERTLHFVINAVHPIFNFAFGFARLFKGIGLTFIRSHVSDNLVALSKSQLFTVIEQFQQVLLDVLRVTRTQNLKQVIIRDEVEARENALLAVKIVSQRFLAAVKFKGNVLELIETLTTFSLNTAVKDNR